MTSATFACPECASILPMSQQSCSCGWRFKQPTAPVHDTFTRCAYEAFGEQCRYPGTQASSSAGPWYCTEHVGCKKPEIGRRIIEQSRSYRHRTNADIVREHTDRAKAWLAERGINTVDEMREAAKDFAARLQLTMPTPEPDDYDEWENQRRDAGRRAASTDERRGV